MPTQDLYQGTTSVVPDPSLLGWWTLRNKLFSDLPKASAQLPGFGAERLKESLQFQRRSRIFAKSLRISR